MESNYQEHLALLASRPEFKAFLRLLEVEEKNIVVRAFKVNSSDPALAIKKAFNEGEIYQLRKWKRTFENAIKGIEEKNERPSE